MRGAAAFLGAAPTSGARLGSQHFSCATEQTLNVEVALCKGFSSLTALLISTSLCCARTDNSACPRFPKGQGASDIPCAMSKQVTAGGERRSALQLPPALPAATLPPRFYQKSPAWPTTLELVLLLEEPF